MVLATLVLRDVQLGPAPGWWPPAPGWWLLALLLLMVCTGLLLWQVSRWRRRRRWQQYFDAAMAAASEPLQQVQQASALLRRAALDAEAPEAALSGPGWEQWLRAGQRSVDETALQVLVEGGFQRQLDAARAQAACQLARRCFVARMVQR